MENVQSLRACPSSIISALVVFLVFAAVSAAVPEKIQLRDGWAVRSAADVKEAGSVVSTPGYKPAGWYPTRVPATVVATLVENQVYPDPHFGMNVRKMPGVAYPIGANFSNIAMPDDSPFKSPWWYRTEFTLPAQAGGHTVWLNFDGINYRANIWLNGQQIGTSKEIVGAYRVYQLDVTSLVTSERPNVLAVEVTAPRPDDLGITFVDWNPAPPDKMMGLYRDVHLTITGPVSVRYPQVISQLDLPALTKARLAVNVELRNAADRKVAGVLKGKIEAIEFSQAVELGPKETREVSFSPDAFPQLNIESPRVWWPAELGAQPLYPLAVEFLENGKVSDGQAIRFGIREMSSEFNEQGYRVLRVNGQRILIRGAGYTPEMLLREPAERQEAEIRYVKHLNLNTIRLEGKLEDDHFLDLCDEQGLLLMAGWCCCDQWEKWKDWDDEDHRVAAESLESQMRRLRHHASLVMWLNGSDNPPPAKVEKMYLDIEKKLHWPNPIVSSATDKPAELSGPSGVKMRGPYEYVPPSYWFLDKKNGGAFSFATEIGPGPAVPPVESLRRMLPPDHLWPIDEYWDFHCGGGAFKNLQVFTAALNGRYGEAKSLEDYAKKAQAMAYEAHRAMFEGYNRNRYLSTGVIQWMLNNAWPSMIWHLYDFYLRPGGSYFGTRLACEPLHIQYSYDDRSIVVSNAYYKAFNNLKATVQVFDFSLGEKFSKTEAVNVEPDGIARVLTIPDLPGLSDTYFLKLKLEAGDGKMLSSNFYWLSTKPDVLNEAKTQWYYTPISSYANLTELQNLPEAQLTGAVRYEVKGQDQLAHVMIQNPSRSLAFMVRLQITKGAQGEEILPVLWDDNYFSLLPGEKREITASYGMKDLGNTQPVAVVEAWNSPRKTLGR